MPWFVCRDATFHYKVHTVNADLKGQLIKDLEDRGDGFELSEDSEITEEQFFEPGGYGMYHLNQPRTNFELGDKELRIDCAKVPELLSTLRSAACRTFDDGTEYYKLYSRFHCLVLSKMERESLLFQLVGRLGKATQEADEFFDAAEERWQKAKAAYEEEHGEGSWPILRAQDLKDKDKEPN
jgi:hypothetical protein